MIKLSGIEVREQVAKELKKEILTFPIPPKLLIIQIGHNSQSEIYIKQKKIFGESLGVIVEHIVFSEKISEGDLLKKINDYNNDESVNGIIVQLPIPDHFDKRKILDAIASQKDVDGLGSVQAGLFYTGDKRAMVPATARGVMTILNHYSISLKGQNVCIVGRSLLVGRPLMIECLNKDATVNVCHSLTKDLEKITGNADILIVAVGKKNFISSKHVKPGQVVVDVGINTELPSDPSGKAKIAGDVDFLSVKDIVHAITPVPGGVGPMTVVSLFQNLVDAKKDK